MSGTGENVVECPVRGPQGPAYVCRHLNLHDPVGFVEGYDPARPDEDLFQAWFAARDEVAEPTPPLINRSAVADPRSSILDDD